MTRPRGRGRPFEPGKSGNPGGRPRRLRDIDADILEKWGPKSDVVITKLYALALNGNVNAAKEFLERVLGRATVLPRERPVPTRIKPLESVLELREMLLSVVHREAAGLAAAAKKRSLTPDEAGILSGYLRVLSSDKPEGLSDAELKRIVGLDAAGVASKG